MKRPSEYLCLNQLEKCDWGDAPDDATGLIQRCHDYRRIPLRNLTAEHLRTLILQNIGLPFLVPLAIRILEKNPLADVSLYPGVLLETVLGADSEYWVAHPAERGQVRAITEHAYSLRETLDPFDCKTLDREVARARDIFERAEYFAKHGRS
jgi:hypothetical protein